LISTYRVWVTNEHQKDKHGNKHQGDGRYQPLGNELDWFSHPKAKPKALAAL